jgi:hypothetical protein
VDEALFEHGRRGHDDVLGALAGRKDEVAGLQGRFVDGRDSLGERGKEQGEDGGGAQGR